MSSCCDIIKQLVFGVNFFKNISQKTVSGLSKYMWVKNGLQDRLVPDRQVIIVVPQHGHLLSLPHQKPSLRQHTELGTLNVENEFFVTYRRQAPLFLSTVK